MDAKVNAAADTDTNQIVQDLNAKWRNYLNEQMNLDPDTFQLAQGCLGLQTSDNYGLFLMSDAVPPSSAVGYYDATSMKQRTSAYSMLLGALLPEVGADALRTALGNNYTPWIQWSQANAPAAGDTYASRLNQWGMAQAIDPGTIAQGQSAIMKAQNSELVKAQTAMWTNASKYQQQFALPGEPTATLYVYTNTVDVATNALQTSAGLTLNFDSSTGSSTVSHTFVEGSASGFYEIFSGGASASFEQLNSKAASSTFTITGRIGAYATVPVGAGGWYDSAEVDRAFNGENDNTIWDPSSASGTYDSYFGQPDGALARYVSQLVLVSDYSITVTSKATYSQEDFQQIKAQASFGVWPFFSASGSATHTTDYKLNSNSELETTYTLNKGLIQIWGVNIQEQH
jgi:hypothetical protein